MLRILICTFLIASVAFAQNPSAGTTPQAPQKQTVKKRRGSKGLWITIAVVTGVAVTALVLVNKRLSNEGHGIF